MIAKRLAEGSETWDPDKNVCTEAEIPYLVIEPESKNAAIMEVVRVSPTTYGGIPRKSVRFDGFENGNILCSVTYETPASQGGGDDSDDGGDDSGGDDDAPVEEGTMYMQVSVSTATMHTTKAISQDAVGKIPDKYKKYIGHRIGWNGKTDSDCEYAGVDIPIGQVQVVYYGKLRNSRLTPKYLARVGELGGKINSGSWKGWPKETLMFIGANIPVTSGHTTDCTFTFQFQPPEFQNIDGKSVQKDGWDYVWGVPHLDVPPIVSKVVPTANFSILGI